MFFRTQAEKPESVAVLGVCGALAPNRRAHSRMLGFGVPDECALEQSTLQQPRATSRNRSIPAYRLTVPAAQTALPSFAEEVRAGLSASERSLPCRFFYDEVGSKIFEEICSLDEYYLTRVERSLLHERAAEIAAWFEGDVELVEFGSGSAEKTRVLIDALLTSRESLVYVPIDISRSALEESAEALLLDHPGLSVHAICGEYETALASLRGEQARPRLVLWLGSSIGNLHKPDAAAFLRRVSAELSPRDRMLVGIDLRKDRERLERAYDDSAGVTARFNKNLLTRINRELGGNFDPNQFEFEARYREDSGAVESSLVSACDQTVDIEEIDASFSFARGQRIHTENSYKYSLDEIETLTHDANMRYETRWLDDDRDYSVNLFAPA